ncbi:MAG TPA: zinc-ribbon domain-containing protein, partial [Rhizomicrobium sp.]|nr:zinc-ribbon domain-containing protein [Rhizomicrobium sp.]
MILTCPQCATRYQADAAKFPAAGRSVRCAKCGNVWHQLGPEPQPDPEAEIFVQEPERQPEPEPAPIAAAPRVAAFSPSVVPAVEVDAPP